MATMRLLNLRREWKVTAQLTLLETFVQHARSVVSELIRSRTEGEMTEEELSVEMIEWTTLLSSVNQLVEISRFECENLSSTTPTNEELILKRAIDAVDAQTQTEPTGFEDCKQDAEKQKADPSDGPRVTCGTLSRIDHSPLSRSTIIEEINSPESSHTPLSLTLSPELIHFLNHTKNSELSENYVFIPLHTGCTYFLWNDPLLQVNSNKKKGSENKPEFIFVTVTIESLPCRGLLDTGANVNLMPQSVADQLKLKVLACKFRLNTAHGHFNIDKAVVAPVTLGCYTHDVRFLLHESDHLMILGIGVFQTFKLLLDYHRTVKQFNDTLQDYHQLFPEIVLKALTVRLDEPLPDAVTALIENNKQIFVEHSQKIGKITTEKCHLRLTSQIPFTLRPYPCKLEMRTLINDQIKIMLSKGLIRDSTSPYSFPVVMVDKKDEGKKTRLCINYIKLNEVTMSEHFPMPKIDEMQDLFLNSAWFTTIDISQGFYHIEMAEEDKAKTAFSTVDGHYEWNRMPFGLKNAPIVFQRVISNLLKKHGFSKFALNYIDDIIVFSETLEQHIQHLKQLFKMVAEENIVLKLSKCQFAKKSVLYLGYTIGQNHVKPLKSNTEAIEKVQPPSDLKSLRSFLGKVNYYQRFIPNRAALLHPLYQLLRKNREWKWEEKAQKAFEQVKVILTTSPVLRIFDPSFPTYLYTDASQKGIGAVLKQSDPKDPAAIQHPVGYFSRSLQSYQQNYSATELELLAIISAIDYWHYYLIGKFFIIYTDHLPLKSVAKIGKPNTRLFNWALRLKQYDFKVEYRPGEKNQEADYLSRHPIQLLNELTEGRCAWIDADKVERAHQLADLQHLPRKVFKLQTPSGVKLIRKDKDQVKEYVPDDLAEAALTQLHLEKGHAGQKQLELQFLCKYYNPRLVKIVRSIILNCKVCAQVKIPKLKYGTLGVIGPAKEPFDIIHIDTKSGFKGYGSNKNHIHLAIDAFTRFVWATTSSSRDSNDFVHLINCIIPLRKPKLIVADNYSAIKGGKFRSYLHKLDIPITFTAVDHQASNGIVERANQTLVERLKCKRLESVKTVSWATQFRECLDEYNRSVHSSTLYTPLYLLTGIDDEKLFEGETLEESRRRAFENSNLKHDQNAQQFDRYRKDPDIQIGEEVMVRPKNKLNQSPLDPPYEGPFFVTNRIGFTTYEVDRNGQLEKFHVSQLKLLRQPKYISRRKFDSD